jgi:hypothetical protein
VIAGIVGGVVGGIVLLVVLCCLLCCQGGKNQTIVIAGSNGNNGTQQYPNPPSQPAPAPASAPNNELQELLLKMSAPPPPMPLMFPNVPSMPMAPYQPPVPTSYAGPAPHTFPHATPPRPSTELQMAPVENRPSDPPSYFPVPQPKTQQRVCGICTAALEPDAAFCENCGSPA